jgi:pyridoxine 5'-phosphate synthase PdxJ
MNEKELLKQEHEACNIHADRIEKASVEITKFLPLSVDKIQNMNTAELAVTELLTGRFAKLQDAIGEKIFPLILVNLGEDIKGRSFIDRLNLLEKLGYINDAGHWFDYRNARNAVSHEYPDSPELMLKNLTEILSLAKELLEYWKNLDQKIKQIIS